MSSRFCGWSRSRTLTVPFHGANAVVVLYLTLGLLFTAIYLYLPQRLLFLSARASYYLFGREALQA